MSKSWAPAPDGQPVHTTKVRIIGADVGTDAYQAVLDQHLGIANQFLRAQHQRAKLSGLNQHKASINTGGAIITYHNNHGQDTLTIDVTAPQTGEGSEEVMKPDYFSWALIEFEIAGVVSGGVDYDIYAELQVQLNGQKVWAHGTDSSDNTLRFAEWQEYNHGVDYASTVHQDLQRSSLLVDLTKFAHGGTVAVDLYAQVSNSPVSGYPGFSGTPMATVSAVLTRFNPFNAVSQTLAIDPTAGYPPAPLNQVVYDLWENNKIYPQRHNMGVAPSQVPVPIGPFPGGGTPDNHFTMPLVGTVTLTPSVEGGGFNLKAA